jgi:DNA-binding IclR family transcriptional regulator
VIDYETFAKIHHRQGQTATQIARALGLSRASTFRSPATLPAAQQHP